MKIHLDDLEKYIRTNKITVYDIFTEARKMPVYSSSDELSIDEAVEKVIETFNSMPSGLYGFRGKKSITAPNNSISSVDVLVGNPIDSHVTKSNHSAVPRMQTFTQEDIDKQIKHALEMQQKDYDLKECNRKYDVLDKRFDAFIKLHNELATDFDELLEHLNLEGIRGKGGVTDMAKTAMTTAFEHGTKKVIDRFANYKS